jgi:hypothetical protein
MGRGRHRVAAAAAAAIFAALSSGCVASRLPASRPFEAEPVDPVDFSPPPKRLSPLPVPRQVVAAARPRRRPTGLALKVDPPDASVFVNGQPHGPADVALGSDGTLELAPGLYRIVVERPGWQTWRGEVAVGAQPVPVEVSLPRSE